MGVNYYPQSGRHIKFYPRCKGKEIDLRYELETIFYGAEDMCVHSHPVMYRRLNGERCTCWNDVKHEGDPRCPYCRGETYLWSEEIWNAYSMVTAPIYGKSMTNIEADIQKMHSPSSIFYFESDVDPKVGDAVIEIKLDSEGRIVDPVKQIRKHRIQLAEHMRADNGRVEYYRVSCKLEPLS